MYRGIDKMKKNRYYRRIIMLCQNEHINQKRRNVREATGFLNVLLPQEGVRCYRTVEERAVNL